MAAGTKAVLAALEGLLSANGLAAADVKAYIDPKVVYDARKKAKQGLGLPAASLEELQQGLANRGLGAGRCLSLNIAVLHLNSPAARVPHVPTN